MINTMAMNTLQETLTYSMNLLFSPPCKGGLFPGGVLITPIFGFLIFYDVRLAVLLHITETVYLK